MPYVASRQQTAARELLQPEYGGRDISAALNGTIFAIQVMQSFNAAICTLENVSELHQFFKGKYATAHVFNMKQHCRLAQERKRRVLALSYPNSDEVSKQTGFRKRR